MTSQRCTTSGLRGGRFSLGALLRDRKGASALEFAFLAPILIMIYIGSFELSVGFTVARKVSQASSTVSDLLSQGSTVNTALLDGMKNIVGSIIAPYPMANYSLKITGIKITGTGTGRVEWSRDQNAGTPYSVGTTINLPSSLATANAFVIRTELTVPYQVLLFTPPGVAANSLQTINLSKTYYFRQRLTSTIPCTNCT